MSRPATSGDATSPTPPVLIVGGGMAGLTCARRLHQAHVPFQLYEAAGAVGGRVRTDVVDGFRLDRGFQVLQMAYPMARKLLDYDALDLRPFIQGAQVFYGGRFHAFYDPLDNPSKSLQTVASSLGSLADKVKLWPLRQHVRRTTIDQLFAEDETTITESLRTGWGFSELFVKRFFRPFFAGITFDPDLATSSRVFHYVMKMFVEAPVAVPAQGMQAIPEHLASVLPAKRIHLNAPVQAISGTTLTLANGTEVGGQAVVVATEGPAAQRLTGKPVHTETRSVTNLYFAAPAAPTDEAILLLAGEPTSPINNVTVMSNVAPRYAPDGQALISVTTLGIPADDAAMLVDVRMELRRWFGAAVDSWRHLRTYHIEHALPTQPPTALEPPQRPVRFGEGLYICGDHRDNASINGAMESGWRTAEAVLADLNVPA